MARFFVTSDDAAHARVTAGWRDAGMPEGADLHAGRVRVATARKRTGRQPNGPVRDGERWAVGVGTYASFGGAVGTDALAEVLAAFDPEAPLSTRRLIFGHYGLVISVSGRLFVLTDAVESYDTVYSQDPDDPARFAVGTMMTDVMRAAPGAVISPLSAFKASYNGERGLAGRTAAEGVRALGGYEALVIDQDAPRMRVVSFPRPARPAAPGREEAVAGYVRACARVLSVLPRFGSLGLNMTGGIDSRLLAAAVSANGLSPTLLYGEGNSAMTNTRAKDREIAAAIGAAKGWPLRLMDWRQDVPHDVAARARLRGRYGLKQLYGGTAGMTAVMEATGERALPDLQVGAYTPPFTNHKPWDVEGARPPLAAVADALSGNEDALRTRADRAAHREGLMADLRALAASQGIEVRDDTLAREDYVRLLVEARRSKDAFNIVAFNQFGAYLAPFFTTDLYEAVTCVPAELRAGDWFQLAVIEAMDPALLDYSVFSGIKPFAVDRAALTMRRERASKPTGASGMKQRVEARLPLILRRNLRTLRGVVTRPDDRTWAFRAALRRSLARDVPGRTVCPARYAEEDLRVVYRYVNLLEASRELEEARRADGLGEAPGAERGTT